VAVDGLAGRGRVAARMLRRRRQEWWALDVASRVMADDREQRGRGDGRRWPFSRRGLLWLRLDLAVADLVPAAVESAPGGVRLDPSGGPVGAAGCADHHPFPGERLAQHGDRFRAGPPVVWAVQFVLSTSLKATACRCMGSDGGVVMSRVGMVGQSAAQLLVTVYDPPHGHDDDRCCAAACGGGVACRLGMVSRWVW
jgi:hypothetical protein